MSNRKLTKEVQKRYYKAIDNKENEEAERIRNEEIMPYIREEEGKAKVRLIDESDYKSGVSRVRALFSFASKKHLKGTSITYCPKVDIFAKSYKGIPVASYITWTHDGSDWFISEIDRCICNRKHQWKGTLSESAKKEIIDAIERGDYM